MLYICVVLYSRVVMNKLNYVKNIKNIPKEVREFEVKVKTVSIRNKALKAGMKGNFVF